MVDLTDPIWVRCCLQLHGRVLSGSQRHWCEGPPTETGDDLEVPADETTGCRCGRCKLPEFVAVHEMNGP